MTAKTKTAAAVNVIAITKRDSKVHAADHGKAERAAVLGNLDTAEDLYGVALLEGLRMTILHGQTSAAEIKAHYTRCGSPDVYASWFNRGYKAQQIVGEKLALQTIDLAVKGVPGGGGFVRARDALKAVIDAAKEAGSKTLAAKPAQQAVKAAVAKVSAPKAKAEKSATAKRGTKSQDDATLVQAQQECGKGAREMAHAVRQFSQQGHKMAAPVGREAAWGEALAALATAAEKFAVFLK